MGAKCKFITSRWNGDLVPRDMYDTNYVCPAFVLPMSIKLKKLLPKKLPTTAFFLQK
jgi:hypothetical protein